MPSKKPRRKKTKKTRLLFIHTELLMFRDRNPRSVSSDFVLLLMAVVVTAWPFHVSGQVVWYHLIWCDCGLMWDGCNATERASWCFRLLELCTSRDFCELSVDIGTALLSTRRFMHFFFQVQSDLIIHSQGGHDTQGHFSAWALSCRCCSGLIFLRSVQRRHDAFVDRHGQGCCFGSCSRRRSCRSLMVCYVLRCWMLACYSLWPETWLLRCNLESLILQTRITRCAVSSIYLVFLIISGRPL